MKISGIALAITSAVAFGLYPAAARGVYESGGNAAFIIITTTLARTVVLCIASLLEKQHLFGDRKFNKLAITGGFFQAVSVIGIFASLTYLPAPIMIIIISTCTLMLLFFMAWRREIKLTVHALLSTLVALLGLTFVLDIWSQGQNYSLIGLSLAFMAAIATTSRMYVYSHQIKTRPPAVVGAENFLFALIFVSCIVFFSLPQLPQNGTGYLYTAYACLSLCIGTLGMFYGMEKIGAFRFSLFLKLEPVFTALFAVLLINERLAWHQYLGMLIVIGSLAVYQVIDRKKDG